MGESIKLSELKTDFTKKTIYDIIKGIVLIVATVGLGYIYKSKILDKFELFSFAVGAITASVLLIIISIVVKYLLRKFKPDFPRISPDFEILETKVTYDHEAIDKMTYTKRKKLKALRNGLERYVDRYSWTGKGNINISSNKKSQTFTETERKSIYQFYEVRFDKVLSKGEEVEVTLTWDLEDLEHKAVPFVSMTIEEPTETLLFKVIFPKTSVVTSIIKEISPFIGAKQPFFSEKERINDYEREYEWTIKKPKLFYHYELRWRW